MDWKLVLSKKFYELRNEEINLFMKENIPIQQGEVSQSGVPIRIAPIWDRYSDRIMDLLLSTNVFLYGWRTWVAPQKET